MAATTTETEAPFPDQTEHQEEHSDYARGYRSGLNVGMEAGHAGGRAEAQVHIQQYLEDRLAALPSGEEEAARVLRCLTEELPDPRRNRRVG